MIRDELSFRSKSINWIELLFLSTSIINAQSSSADALPILSDFLEWGADSEIKNDLEFELLLPADRMIGCGTWTPDGYDLISDGLISNWVDFDWWLI